MASADDYFKKVGSPGNATTLAAPGHTIGGTSFTVDATSLWPTDTGVTFAIDTVTVAGGETRVPGTYTVWDGVVSSGTTITGAVLRYGTDQNYSAGSTTRVYILPTSTRENKLVDGLLIAHEQTGIHKSGASYPAPVFSGTATGTYTLGGTPTISSPILSGTTSGTYTMGGTVSYSGTHSAWVSGVTVPNTVTYNGNRSYDLVVNSTDLTGYLSAGMRLRTTRTSAAPTQCTSLNGTTQYYSKSSPNKLTFTDDFVVSAWIKLSSYPSTGVGSIASRNNGTSGWLMDVTSTGQVLLAGYNGGLSNVSYVQSYQSVPLNKWVHVTAQLDMSTFTATTTTSYVMFDGLDVPASVARGGTNPTALVQAGDLNIGSYNAGAANSFFPGKIAQVAIYNAKVTQANIRATISQGLTGSETSLASAYSFNNSITDLNTSTPNDLSAVASAVATNADSPFGGQADGTISSTLDYAIITKTAFSTNTTLTVQVPEGCTIPTTGGVSAVSYSTQKAPYLMPTATGKWRLVSLLRTSSITTSNATYGSFQSNGWALTVPIGSWDVGWQASLYCGTATELYYNISSSALTGLTATTGYDASPFATRILGTVAGIESLAYVKQPRDITSTSTYVMYTLGATVGASISGAVGLSEIFAEFSYL